MTMIRFEEISSYLDYKDRTKDLPKILQYTKKQWEEIQHNKNEKFKHIEAINRLPTEKLRRFTKEFCEKNDVYFQEIQSSSRKHYLCRIRNEWLLEAKNMTRLSNERLSIIVKRQKSTVLRSIKRSKEGNPYNYRGWIERKTSCSKGHPYTQLNGRNICRTCLRLGYKKRREMLREKRNYS